MFYNRYDSPSHGENFLVVITPNKHKGALKMRNVGSSEIFTIYLVEIRLNIFTLNLTQILPILVRGFLGCSEPHWSGLHKYICMY
jgi:hypothetical protein